MNSGDANRPIQIDFVAMDSETPKILVVDDDADLRNLLQRYLSEQGFDVTAVEDGPAMDAYLADQHAELIILDLMLPGEDGLSIARRLQNSHNIPIIMLSARGDDVDRIVGLEVGADDYLPKPFNPRELLARIRAVLRRPAATATEPGDSEQQIFTFGPYQFNLTTRELKKDNQKVALTTGEYSLLAIFVQHPNRVLSRDMLVDMIKGFDRSPYDRSIDVRVTRLRRKIEPDPASPLYIQTVWGEGYRFLPGSDNRNSSQ
jgi:DNA-binding response OmpR family regulator